MLKTAADITREKETFAYRALIHTPTRPMPSSAVVTVDEEIGGRRRLAWALTRDLEENFIIAGWAVEKHLIYTSSFNFQARTPYPELDRLLESYMYERFKKKNFDVAARLSLEEMIHLFTAQKIWDGDAAILKCDNGKFQLLESWQIAKQECTNENVNNNGLLLDKYGAVRKYALCTVQKNEKKFSRLIPAEYVIFDGYFKRANQTRGVSPIMPSINTARDLMDAQAYHLLKAKLGAMFGIVIYRDHGIAGRTDFNYTGQVVESSEQKQLPLRYELKPGLKLELDRNDKAEFLESKNPPVEFQNYVVTLIRQILASLKIPYSMYDSNAANYSAKKADAQAYKTETERERKKTVAVLDEITETILRYDIASGALKLPHGITYDNIDWEWIPTASFIFDRSGEVKTLIEMINSGLISRSDVIKELGTGSFDTVTEKLAFEQAELKRKGVTVSVAMPGAQTTQVNPDENPDNPPKSKEGQSE